ncbi:MAG: DUF3352 domain-containing protein [Spirulina sp.]
MVALSVLTVAPMKFRTFIIPLALAAGLILVLGVGLLGGLALRTPLYLLDRGGQAVPEALQFVPRQSALVASVLARPDRLAQLWDYLAEPKRRPSLRSDRERLEQALLAQTGLTYDRDILPWLGEEITVALVAPDVDQDPRNGITPGYLVALSCRDDAKAQATLELFWQNRALAGDPLTFEDLGGAPLIYGRGSASPSAVGVPPLATAVIAKRFVLVANDPSVLRQAIAAAQASDGSVKTDQRYKLALNALPQSRIGLVAVNLPQVERWLHPELADTVLAQAPQLTESAPLGWGLVSLGLQRQGVMAEAAWVVAPGHRLAPHQRQLTDWYPLARYLPGTLSLEALGLNLADLESQLRSWLAPWVGSGEGLALPQPSLEDRMGPGITGQILASVDQAYALGLDLQANATPPHWLLASPSSLSTADLIDRLGRQASAYDLGSGRLDILGYPTTVWTRLSLRQGMPGRSDPLQVQTEVVGLSAEVGRDQVLTTSPAMMAQAIGVDQHQTLPPPWTEQIRTFPQAGESYVHLDWLPLADYLRQQVPQFRLWETIAYPILKHLGDMTLVSYGQTDQVHRDSLLINLQNP